VSVMSVASKRVGRRAIESLSFVAIVALAFVCGVSRAAALGAAEPTDSQAIDGAISPLSPGQSFALPMPGALAARVRAGNPLWAVPLRLLTETRERPLFSPSRRPPPAVVAAPAVAPARAAARPAEPDHPLLTLVGTVVGTREGIGIFIDQSSKNVIRLRTGQGHDGWSLRAVHQRDAVFERRAREAILALPAPDSVDQSATNAVNSRTALPSGTWMDGDGQMISPPTVPANGRAQRASALSTATWMDGDGQLISPPEHN
jgi:general secretion pathway protein N